MLRLLGLVADRSLLVMKPRCVEIKIGVPGSIGLLKVA
jgi:hypothetical protein